MRIGIDARFLTYPQVGGFASYTKNLVAGLSKVDADNEYILYVDRPVDSSAPEIQLLQQRPSMRFRVVTGGWPLIGAMWREQIGLPIAALKDKLDLFHAPALTAPIGLGCAVVVTLHDMIWHAPPPSNVTPSVKRRLMAGYYRYIPALAASRAAMIITVSNAARTDIMRHLRLPTERIAVTLEAANEVFKPMHDATMPDAFKQAYGIDPGFVLAMGSSDPRKNVSAVVEAYARLPQPVRERHHLAIVWAHPRMAEMTAKQVAALGIQPDVHFLHGLSNQQLAQVYGAAALFVFPSRYEGFGLPPLEAMSCGTPVVAANNSSIPEVVGDAGILFETEDLSALASGMERVLTDLALHRDLAARGLARAAEFSWERCARQTVEAYAQAVNVRNGQLAKAA